MKEYFKNFSFIPKKKEIKSDEFECHICRGVFKKGFTDAEAMQEYVQDFGVEYAALEPNNNIYVCDNCYELVDPKKHPEQLKNALEELKKRKIDFM